MALQAIFQTSLIDNHKDCLDGRSMINVQVTELIRQLQKDGFKLIDSNEQGYYRQVLRSNHGVYSVYLTCDSLPELALMIVDSKDCQTSLRLYIALKDKDVYFPVKLIGKLRHNKKNAEKFEALKLYISELALNELNQVNSELNSIDSKELTEKQLIDISEKLTCLKRVNYKASEAITLINHKASNTLMDACYQLAVKWVPHQLKYCCEAYRLISEA